ncbi:hypothetical protein AMJ85_02370 [candidate division BRC1 bacterium SM23_51]|nr:MAG: hypothetical protein AMJ85_02370 [candidate division BRC1 bacterium SM23_51]
MADLVPATAVDAAEASVGGESLEIRDAAINIEEVMTRIRGSIEEKKKSRAYRQDALLAQGIDLLQLSESSKSIADHLTLLKYAARIDLEGEQITSHRPFMGFAIKCAKRLTRLWIRKYTDSIFTKQNHFNAEMISVLSELNHRLEELKAESARLRELLETFSRR